MSNYKSIADFNKALLAAQNNMPSAIVQPVKAAFNALAARIKLRVASTGQDSEGGSFSPYSAKYKAVKQKRGISPYGKITSKKNFYLTGNMWGGFGVSNIQSGKESVFGRLDFMGNNVFKSNRELNEIHSDNEGKGIGYPTKEEEEQLTEDITEVIYLYLRAAL